LGFETAKRTLEVMTHVGVRKYVHPVARRFRIRQHAIRYPRLSGKFYTDTMFSPTVSLHGNTCAQVFTDRYGYDEFYPLKSKADASRGLLGFIEESGVPGWLISDGALKQRTRHWQDVVQDYQICQTLTEPYSPCQNKAKSSIRAIKRGIHRFMQSEGPPKRTWYFCGEWYAGTRRLTAHDMPILNGRVQAERVDGKTPDTACTFSSVGTNGYTSWITTERKSFVGGWVLQRELAVAIAIGYCQYSVARLRGLRSF
jgi:hypothetical protein